MKPEEGKISRVLSSSGGDHSSGTAVTCCLERPTRGSGEAGHFSPPIWSCSEWGLPCLRHHCQSGELLPHLFTLTPRRRRYVFCGTFRRVSPPGCYPASCPVEPGLSSFRL